MSYVNVGLSHFAGQWLGLCGRQEKGTQHSKDEEGKNKSFPGNHPFFLSGDFNEDALHFIIVDGLMHDWLVTFGRTRIPRFYIPAARQ